MTYDQKKASAACAAIELLGGPEATARKLRQLTGKPCTRHRVQKWKLNGVAANFCPPVHQLTAIPLPELDPEVYPEYLFT